MVTFAQNPIDLTAGGKATEQNARGQALRSLGFAGDFNQGTSGFGGLDFLKEGGVDRANSFNDLFKQFSDESDQVNSSTGIVPIGVVEPLSATTRQGIERIHGGVDNSSNDNAINQLLGLVNQAATAPTDADFNASFEKFSNPFQQQVIDRAIANINREESIRQSQLSRDAQANNAFGGSAQGVQAGILGGESLRNIGDITASLEAANFDQATQNALAELQRNVTNQFTGAQIGSQLLGDRQNLQTSNLQNLLTQGQAEIGAGGVVQTQNQRLLDAITAERNATRALPEQQLQQALAVIQAFSGGGSGTAAVQGSTPINNVLGGALVGSSLTDDDGNFDLSSFLGGS